MEFYYCKPRLIRGMTLAELLIVIVIIALLAVMAMIGIKKQLDRSYDARRKSDLAIIRTALENYYNDNTAYPINDTWNAMNCKTKTNMDFLTKYLDNKPIPCDPQSNTPYLYDSTNQCGGQGYAILAALRDTGDPDITKLGCGPINGCGYGLGYNFGYGVGNCTVAIAGFNPGIAPTPTTLPGSTPGNWGCTSDGSGTMGCNMIGKANLDAAYCPSFSTNNCDGQCPSHPEYRYTHCR